MSYEDLREAVVARDANQEPWLRSFGDQTAASMRDSLKREGVEISERTLHAMLVALALVHDATEHHNDQRLAALVVKGALSALSRIEPEP